MPVDLPPAHTIDVLNTVLTEDEVRSWVARWQAAGNRTRKAMETEAALRSHAQARRDPERSAERRRLREVFEREGLEGDRGAER